MFQNKAPAFWLLAKGDPLLAFGSTDDGLSAGEAAERLRRDGPNSVTPLRRVAILKRIAHKLADPLVAILLVAAAVSGISGDGVSFGIIAAIVILSIGLDVAQEHRAETAVDALRKSVALTATVRRSGVWIEAPVETLVSGDIVSLRAGDLVPADGLVLESRGAMANESLLTGEAYPIEKRKGPSLAREPGAAFDALFGGTALVSGEALMVVAATGPRSCFGGIAAALEASEPPTAFERGLRQLGVLILRLTVFLVLFVLLAHLAFHRPPLESFMFAVALAVGLTPELLPMVTTVTLSRGALRLAKAKVIVKRLAAIHDLGAMDVLCTDKTGTLTQARITLAAYPGIDGGDALRALEIAALNSRLASGVKSPLDAAILAAAQSPPMRAELIDDAPFDFERRRMSVLAETDAGRIIACKGAPEDLIALCAQVETRDGACVPLDANRRMELERLQAGRATRGFRLLGVAWRPAGPDQAAVTPADEVNLIFVGFCAFLDPPKASAPAAISRLKSLGVGVKVISGDAAPVVAHLAEALDLPGRVLMTGAELAGLSDAALMQRIEGVDLFARVSPDQKSRIIHALRDRGHTVGFLGDGINDAPAIKAADCGLSVDGATDVARAAADLILLESDLSVLADGIEEGRRTYANITKYVRMGTSSNFGNMLSMALASLVIPFLPMTAIQILLNNFLYDLSEIGIPFDSVDAREVAAPHSWDMKSVLRFTLTMGPLSSVFDIATFTLLLTAFEAGAAEFQTAWFVESITTQVLVIFLIRTQGLPWLSRPHPVLAATSLGALGLALFAALGPFAAIFGFAPLPGYVLAGIALLVIAYLVCAEALKRFAMRSGQ